MMTCSSNDSVKLVFLASNTDLICHCQPVSKTLPSYTHQIFENETVNLGESILDCEVDIFISCYSSHPFCSSVGLHISVTLSEDVNPVQCRDDVLGVISREVIDKLSSAITNTTTPIIVSFATSHQSSEKSIYHFHFNKCMDISDDVSNSNSCLCAQWRAAPPISQEHHVPPGQRVHVFDSRSGDSFEIWEFSATDTGAVELIGRLEKVAIWFIETADSVDFADPRWRALLLVKIAPDNGKIFVGYMTLFSFLNPIHGCKLRVCQALILPPFQGSGLGRELLLLVYRSNQQTPEISELTVEDPCPGFQALRDAVDLEWFVSMEKSYGGALVGKSSSGSSGSAEDVSKRLKITKAQVVFVFEAMEYIQLVNTVSRKMTASTAAPENADGDREAKRLRKAASIPWKQLEDDPLYVEFRLRVKRRLLKSNPDLKALPKSEMQSELGELFNEEQLRFQRIEKVACDRLHILETKTFR